MSEDTVRFLAAASRVETGNGDPVLGLLLALAALPPDRHGDDARVFPDAIESFVVARAGLRLVGVFRWGNLTAATLASFSGDGLCLTTFGWDRTICLWNLVTGCQLAEFPAAAESHMPLRTAALCPDGEFVCLGG